MKSSLLRVVAIAECSTLSNQAGIVQKEFLWEEIIC